MTNNGLPIPANAHPGAAYLSMAMRKAQERQAARLSARQKQQQAIQAEEQRPWTRGASGYAQLLEALGLMGLRR